MSFFRKSGIVNVKMVITEEKILSNIDKIQKLINPNSKKQIVQLEEDSYFKDLVESIKTYLQEYPTKKNFPSNVYKSAYDLVEYATNQFEENTKKIEELIRKRERNIKLASVLRDVTTAVKGRAKNWKEIINKLKTKYSSDVVEALTILGNGQDTESEEYQDACKLLEAKINNLESNLHVEIDIERIEDRTKALSYIGIEIAEALKTIPTPAIEFTKEEKPKVSPKVIKTEPISDTIENNQTIDTDDSGDVFGQNSSTDSNSGIASTGSTMGAGSTSINGNQEIDDVETEDVSSEEDEQDQEVEEDYIEEENSAQNIVENDESDTNLIESVIQDSYRTRFRLF